MKIRRSSTFFLFPGPTPGDGAVIARLGFPRDACSSPGASRGFALVITLSLFVLLTLLAVGLLGLASISLRTTSRGDDAARARANARLALMLAIGQLQRQAGADTRVTARADILAENNPPVLGAWKSWEGADHDSQGRPVSPGDYSSEKKERFLAWLVSTGTEDLPDTSAGAGRVALLGAGSVGDGPSRESLQIYLEPTKLSDAGGDGAFAWWISGENQKARLPKPYLPDEDNAARWSVIAKSHSAVDPSSFRMEDLLEDATPAGKAVSHLSSDFIGEEKQMRVSREFFHDLSVSSMGLLTNTATGGWRKDLSILTENWTSVANSNLPFFRATPVKDIMFTKPTAASPTAARSMIYPWSSYRGTSEMPIYRHGAVSSWENLKDYATAYKRISPSASGSNRIATAAVAIDDSGNTFGFLHKVRILPVVARIQWVLSHTAAPAASPAGSLEPRLLVTPVITMWNPYSVQISTSSTLSFHIPKPLPVALRYTVNGAVTPTHTCLTTGSTNNLPAMSTAASLQYEIPSTFTLKPGETRVFSPQNATAVPATTTLVLAQGYRSKGGHFFQVKGTGGKPMAVGGSATIKADAKFDTAYTDISQGVGIYMDMVSGGQRLLAYRMIYTPSMANEIYKPLTGLAEAGLSASMSNPVPFLSTVFGARMASRTHIPAKGFIQSSPLVNYTAMGSKDVAETTIARHYGGTYHPVNSPFDYSFIKLAPNDSNLPNASDTSGRGYIVTGFNKSDGLSRCVIAEIPTRPLQSLCELQNWDLRYENPIPPYAFNLIGNSDATPLLPSAAVVNSADASLPTNLQHDDSYCANHILFDDWFFSSIAPDPATFGTAGRNMQKTYADFVTGERPLGNRAYLPIAEDAGFASISETNATALYNDNVRGPHAWKTIASRIEVEGMFNVNSTSLTAWRALLGHARKQRVPYIRESGASWSVVLSDESDHPFSRFSMAGDVEAKEQGSSGAFPEAAEFAGYRVFDDKMIDALAEEVVAQVRERGPFLSLSEFINRQLSSGDLALAGAVQSALNELAKQGSTNPYAAIEQLSNNATAVPARAAEAEYKFPAAAEGESAYGLPGWTRQADVLRPIAPILSARDDTFTIRAHGDARDEDGKIVSRAVCEAVVRRTRNYVDPADTADLATPPSSAINKAFGRHFEIVSFRWLSGSEI